ncbi:hypothetical protein Shyhy02_08530 [Streptomyces hygroscopicus subsp. hygroscopicus]|nr:hypothetical protein Shyhy02_08530 [Streptomyces hygroscopicus subsp. hygroscopicus]
MHDERSAAMVAALAAPVTRRGVAVGTLMGTAYLFTEEVVAHGAVQPLFQRQVVAAEHTVLLETAPGHATRCVPSPFTDGFDCTSSRWPTSGRNWRRSASPSSPRSTANRPTPSICWAPYGCP